MHAIVLDQGQTLKDHGTRLGGLELWKHDEEHRKKFLAEYGLDDRNEKGEDALQNNQLIKALVIALSIIAALLGVKVIT